MSFSALSPEQLSLIVNNLQGDKPSLIACSLASRELCAAASVHLFHRCKFVIDANSRPLSLLLDALDRGPRMREMCHLSLARNEPGTKYIDTHTNRGAKSSNKGTGTKGKGKGRDTRETRCTDGEGNGSEDSPVALPPNGHTNLAELHELLCKLPRLRSLSIIRLHIMTGSPLTINHCLLSIKELIFYGVDTASSYYAVLALFSEVGTLSVSDNFNAFTIAAAPPNQFQVFPFTVKRDSNTVLSVDTVKMFNCAPKVMGSWFKAYRIFSIDPTTSRVLSRLIVDEISLLFEELRHEYEAAFSEIWGCVRHIEMDLTAKRSLFPVHTYTCTFPKLGLPIQLVGMQFFLGESQEGFSSIEKFILSARCPNDLLSMRLREIHINVIFLEMTDYFGDPQSPAVVRRRLKAKRWKILGKIVRGFGWLEVESAFDRFICVRLWNKMERDGGRVYLTDVLEDVVKRATTKEPNIQQFLRFG